MGRVLMWLLGVPITVAALFAVLGEPSNASPARERVTINNPGSQQ